MLLWDSPRTLARRNSRCNGTKEGACLVCSSDAKSRCGWSEWGGERGRSGKWDTVGREGPAGAMVRIWAFTTSKLRSSTVEWSGLACCERITWLSFRLVHSGVRGKSGDQQEGSCSHGRETRWWWRWQVRWEKCSLGVGWGRANRIGPGETETEGLKGWLRVSGLSYWKGSIAPAGTGKALGGAALGKSEFQLGTWLSDMGHSQFIFCKFIFVSIFLFVAF